MALAPPTFFAVSLDGKAQKDVAALLKTMSNEVTFEVQHSAALERRISRRQLQRQKELEAQDRAEERQQSDRTSQVENANLAAGAATAGQQPAVSPAEGTQETNENERTEELQIVIEKEASDSLGFGFSAGDSTDRRPLTIRKVRVLWGARGYGRQFCSSEPFRSSFFFFFLALSALCCPVLGHAW